MITMKVWLLVMSGYAHSGGFGAVQPHLYPSALDCEQVAKHALKRENGYPWWRCIETNVLVPK